MATEWHHLMSFFVFIVNFEFIQHVNMKLLLSTSRLYFPLGNISYLGNFSYLLSLDQQNNLIKLAAAINCLLKSAFCLILFVVLMLKICDVLRSLLPLVQFKKLGDTHGRVLLSYSMLHSFMGVLHFFKIV